EADGWPHQPALLLDELDDRGVTVDRLGGEHASERRLRVGPEERKVEAAVVADEEGVIVGDQLGAEADAEEDQEDPERPEAPPIGAEVVESPPEQRSHDSLVAKSMRGSMATYMRSLTRFRTSPTSV